MAGSTRQKAETPEPGTRLLIEEIGDTGRFLYKLIDVPTGNILAQFPREQVEKLAELDSYASGAVVDTQA